MAKDFFDSTLPYILLPFWLLVTIGCVVWAMFPRYHVYERVGRYFYDKVLRRMEPNDRTVPEETFMEHEVPGNHGNNATPAAETDKKRQRRKMRARASTRTAWPMMEEDEIELEDMNMRNVREFV